MWTLRRAFGPLPAALARPDAAAALRLARRLDLAPRIAARAQAAGLEAELGAAARAALVGDRGLHALAAEALLDEAHRIGAAGHRIALLKGAALFALGVVAPGGRPIGDLDLLVPEVGVGACADQLRRLGWSPAPGSVPSEHQLPAFVKAGRSIEIHLHLPGIRIRGAFASYAALAQAGLLAPLPDWPETVSTPRPCVLAAHAAVHGLVQHGFAPRSYPLTRMLADLVDLGAPADRALAEAALALAEAEIPRAEWDETLDTCRALERGGGLDRPLVAHAVLGLIDDAYAASLKLRALGAGPSTLPRPLVIGREAWRALFPGRARLLALEPGGRLRALRRPFAMVLRGLAALWRRPR